MNTFLKRLTTGLLAGVLVVVPLSGSAALMTTVQTEAAPSVGTTYYVSTLNGSDNHNGTTKNSAFYSLHKINSLTLAPGDRILLERGSVFRNQFLHIKNQCGSAANPIQIDAYGDAAQEKPRIDTNGNGVWYQNYGQALDNDKHLWKGYVSSCILLFDTEYIEVKNIAMSNWGGVPDGAVVPGEKGLLSGGDLAGSYTSGTKMNRTGVAVVTQNIGTANHIYLQNLDIRNVFGNVYDKHMNNGGIYFTVAKPKDEESTDISRFHDVLIEGNRLERVSRWGIAAAYTAYWAKFPQSRNDRTGLMNHLKTIPDDVCRQYGMTNLIIETTI